MLQCNLISESGRWVVLDGFGCPLLTCLGSCREAERQRSDTAHLSPQDKLSTCASHLIDSEANRVHVLPLFTELPAVLLDQAYHKTASVFSIIGVIILLLQLNHKLRVHPERVCKERLPLKKRTSIALLGDQSRITSNISRWKTITYYKGRSAWIRTTWI